MTYPAEYIRTIANTGTDQQVAALYLELTGKNITGCPSCQRSDARIHLRIMAKKQTPTETGQTIGGYRLADRYANRTVKIYDRIVKLEDEKDLAWWLRKAAHVLVQVAPAAPVAPSPSPVADPEVTIDADEAE